MLEASLPFRQVALKFCLPFKSQFTFYLIDRLAWALALWATRDNEKVLAQLENLLIQNNWTTLLSP